MEANRVEQREVLETLLRFNERLVKNIGIVTNELSGARMDDTDKFLKSIIDAMNWELAVMNGTMELLNEWKEQKVSGWCGLINFQRVIPFQKEEMVKIQREKIC